MSSLSSWLLSSQIAFVFTLTNSLWWFQIINIGEKALLIIHSSGVGRQGKGLEIAMLHLSLMAFHHKEQRYRVSRKRWANFISIVWSIHACPLALQCLVSSQMHSWDYGVHLSAISNSSHVILSLFSPALARISYSINSVFSLLVPWCHD